MNVEARDLWDRATLALRLAKHDLPMSADGAASWAYYAAFYAVSALFAMEGRTFSKHITPAEAENGIGMAEKILYAVAEAHPDVFTGLPPK